MADLTDHFKMIGSKPIAKAIVTAMIPVKLVVRDNQVVEILPDEEWLNTINYRDGTFFLTRERFPTPVAVVDQP